MSPQPAESPAQVAAGGAGDRFAGLDGFRALAAITVLLVHTFEVSPAGLHQFGTLAKYVDPVGQVALAMFFTLSGYLIYLMFVGPAMKGRDFPSTGAFMFNRLLRIFPAYWVILTVAAVAGLAAGTGGHGLRPGGFDNVGDALLNYSLLQSYVPHTLFSGIGAAWSLSVEIAFYLTLPPLAVLAARLAAGRTGRRRVIAFCVPAVALLFLGVAGKWVTHHVVGVTNDSNSWAFVLRQSIFVKADLVAWGMMVAALVTGIPREQWSQWPARRIALIGIVATLLGTIGGNTVFMAFGMGAFLLWNFISAAGARTSRVWRIVSGPVLAYVGLISYSIYLWHGPVIFFVDREHITTGGWLGVFLNPVLVFAITLGLSALSYRFVEAPMLRRKRSMTRRPAAEPALALAGSRAAP